jgi:CubicO group peptidase (beta-lactamase class C family)
MIKKNAIVLLVLVLVLLYPVKYLLAQETFYPAEVEDKIKQVENSLMSLVQTKDSVKWSLKERMSYYNLHGISIAVIHNYKIEWAKGYGWADTSEHRPVTPQTLFQAASISKSLNAVGVLKLVQDKWSSYYG